MARKRKDDDDDLDPFEIDEEEPIVAEDEEVAAIEDEEPVADDEEVAAIEDEEPVADDEEVAAIEDEEPVADDEEVEDEDDDEAEGEEEPDEEPAPRPRVTILNIVLIVLNMLAAGTFLYLLFMDFQARQAWSFAYFRNQVSLWGLPLQNEQSEPGAREGRPRLILQPEPISKAFRSPGRGGKGADKFAAVDEAQSFMILPDMITDELKAEIFKGLGTPVGTLEDEVARVRKVVPDDIAKKAAEETAKIEGDAQKRDAVQKVLLPLAWSAAQVDVLEAQIQAAKGQELTDLLNESIQRRMYADILAAVNLYRVGNVEKFIVEKAADRSTYPVAKLRELYEKRCDAAIAAKYDPETHVGAGWTVSDRDSLEKRQQTAFLLYTLSQLRAPLDGEKVYPKGVERTQAVVGIHDLTMAIVNYARTQQVLEGRVLENIRYDRSEFIDRYKIEVDRLKELVKAIEYWEDDLAKKNAERDRATNTEKERTEQLKAATEKLVQARKETAEVLQELRGFQQQLFAAELELSDAAERNFQLEAAIRKTEARLRGKKLP